jgi:hypothetical protein
MAVTEDMDPVVTAVVINAHATPVRTAAGQQRPVAVRLTQSFS